MCWQSFYDVWVYHGNCNFGTVSRMMLACMLIPFGPWTGILDTSELASDPKHSELDVRTEGPFRIPRSGCYGIQDSKIPFTEISREVLKIWHFHWPYLASLRYSEYWPNMTQEVDNVQLRYGVNKTQGLPWSLCYGQHDGFLLPDHVIRVMYFLENCTSGV